MARQTFLIYFGLFLLSTISSSVSEAAREKQHRRQRLGAVKLFVFGDSYADTGNCPKPSAASWKEPYGFTFPGTPAGRFSDGRVLTDYIASFLGIPPPLPYQWRKDGKSRAAFGMNFAYGGTGVLNTMVKEPNMTTQIDLFQQLLAEEELYTKRDLNSSIAWVSLGGNDYAAYMASSHGDLQGFPNLTKSVINQLALNLKRIHGLGVKKIAVAAIEPLGCLPAITASSSYQNCSEAENSLSKFHNQLLQEAVHKLNNESGLPVPAFEIIDLHAAFTSALATHQQNHHTGTIKFENPLKPCCVGVEKGYSCGNVDESGAKKYIVCEKPSLSFFWDMIHPSQQGWSAVYSALRPSLHHQLY
ncbi:GDSL esterase/lipase At5g03610-like isoform X2 [Diospyros lotus]|uniref:GDSL esterase/lipase At5g03610-like isoform X2 n=1 Tax=Diospyros lotus TaxID=55363 RepID=UPI002251CFEA|nr:GDSL esterase/lipase At5g03610-like isoform X2 [Diospyros lotus]